jgi:hypothetical protein
MRVKRAKDAADDEPVVMLLDRRGALAAMDDAIYIAMVPDPARLVEHRQPRLHDDVVEALVDLIVELAEGEGTDGSGSGDR